MKGDVNLSLTCTDTAIRMVHPGDTVNIDYSGAQTGATNYVSCVIEDSVGMTHYGKLSTAASGTASFTVPALADGSYIIKLFNEECNGDTSTDFASTPIEIHMMVINAVEDGREIELRNDGTAIQWRYAGEGDDAWRDLATLASLTGATGQDGADGQDGREIELQVSGGYIQWRYIGDTGWNNIAALSAITGPQGPQGEQGLPGGQGQQGEQGSQGAQGAQGANGRDGADGLNGKDGADGSDGKNGKDGNGIAGIAKTATDGNVDTYTISFTDGTSITFTVTNGKDGMGVASAAFNENGELVFTLTDGTEINLGPLPAPGGSVPASGAAESGGADATVPIALGTAALLSAQLWWLIPLLKKIMAARR